MTHIKQQNYFDIQHLGAYIIAIDLRISHMDLHTNSYILELSITVQTAGVFSILTWLTFYMRRRQIFHNERN